MKTQETTQQKIASLATSLRLGTFADYAEYIDPGKAFPENLLALLEAHAVVDEERRVSRRIGKAKFTQVKTLDTFEVPGERLPRLSWNQVLELAAGRFVEEKTDVVAIGPSGVGKTHLAIAIGREIARKGYTVVFKKAGSLINEMVEQHSERQLSSYIKKLARVPLLIIDELGYIDYEPRNANLLFQIVDARYERRSTFITTNFEFSKWVDFLGNEAITTAIVDRITHHAVILNMNGRGWRSDHALSRKGVQKE